MEQTQQPSPEDLQKFLESIPAAISKFAEGGIKEHNGITFLSGISAETCEYIRSWDMPENSVFVSCYQKTGSLWCTEIIRNMLYIHDEATLQRSQSIPPPMYLLELGPTKKFDLYPLLPVPRKVFKTHVPEDYFNFTKMKERKGKMIYVIRNPKDQAVSWFHFSKNFPISPEVLKDKIGTEWNDFLQKYVNGEHPTGLRKGQWYPDHMLGWLKHKDDDSFMIVEYENLKKDFGNEVRRMAKFLDINLSDGDIKRIESDCTIDSMRKLAGRDKSGVLKMNIRKGEVGGWKNQFTVAQSELVDKLIEEKLGQSGITFQYTL